MDNYRRKLFIKYELKNRILSSGIKNDSIPFMYRYYFFYNKTKITRFATNGKHKNRCVLTGRAHGILQKFQYSRFTLRTQSQEGNLPGCRRAS
jgi:small subunit ribosomal protein S14